MTTVASTLPTAYPSRATSATTVRSSSTESAPAQAASVSGNRRADVAEPRSAEQRVHDRVREYVGVGVARQARVVGDLHAAEDQRTAGGEGVRVDAQARAQHQPSGSSRRSRRSNTHSSVTPASRSAATASS